MIIGIILLCLVKKVLKNSMCKEIFIFYNLVFEEYDKYDWFFKCCEERKEVIVNFGVCVFLREDDGLKFCFFFVDWMIFI